MADSPKQVAALLLLPRFYEEDVKGVRKPIEESKFEQTLKEVDAKFGGATLHLAGATRNLE